jgi:hypothetical protein
MPRVRLTVRAMLGVIAGFAGFLMLERLLFLAAVRTLTSPLPTEHVYFAEAVALWLVFNGLAALVLGPIIYAIKATHSFAATRAGWAARMRCWGTAGLFGVIGTVIGALLGFAMGFLAGAAITPGNSSPHNYPGVDGLIVLGGATLAGAVTGAVTGLIAGLVRLSGGARRLRDP